MTKQLLIYYNKYLNEKLRVGNKQTHKKSYQKEYQKEYQNVLICIKTCIDPTLKKYLTDFAIELNKRSYYRNQGKLTIAFIHPLKSKHFKKDYDDPIWDKLNLGKMYKNISVPVLKFTPVKTKCKFLGGKDD